MPAVEWDVFALAPNGSATAAVTLALSAALDDIVDTATAHGYAAGDAVVFTALTGGTGLTVGQRYYVIAANLAATTFQVSATVGGAAINFTADITAGTVHALVLPTYLATLYEAREQSVRVERKGPGSGSFAINRSSPQCSEAILAQGNLVKVRIPEIHTGYIFGFFIETGDFTLISSDEAGGEMLHFGGRGILSYLEYARAWAYSYIAGGQNPIAGVWRAYAAGTGSKPGQILRRMIEEMQDPDRPQRPIPLLTIDFDYTNDSAVHLWDTTDATNEFSYQVGEDGLAISLRLLETEKILVQMSPDFLLSAYNVDQFGRNLSGSAFGAGVVRFERGINIATELRRDLSQAQAVLDTHMLVQGEADKYGTSALTDSAARVTKEGFLAAFGTGITALNAIGAVELRTRLLRSEVIQFPIANRRTANVVLSDPVSIGSPVGLVATDGYYLPGPPGSNGDFWVGDTVRVHTGGGAFDYTEVNAVVEAITIVRDDDNAELIVIPELKTVPTPPGLVSFYTSTNFSGCEVGSWPLGSPPQNALLVGFLAQRDISTSDATIVPIGNGVSYGSEACDATQDIAGTGWTYIDSEQINSGSGQLAQLTLAYRIAAASEPPTIRWGGAGGLAGTSRPRSHQVAITGLSGAPTVTAKVAHGFTSMTSVFTSPPITVAAAGYIFAGFVDRISGPAEGPFPAFVLTPRAPAVSLTQGYAYAGFGPYSWFGYLHVAAAGTYTIVLDRSTGARDNYCDGWVMGFWPE